LLLQLPASYWRDLNAYNPAQAASRLRIPIFILQGERDYQVTLKDLQGWRDALAGRSDVRIRTYPNLNHLFMPGDGASRPDEYFRPNRVAPEVVADIVAWIDQTISSREPLP
jgi:fermentation-respiration switch protein FrsA (DUF1100 family)